MTQAQVKTLRQQINAAHASGNTAEADRLQAQLHAHFVAESDKFMRSPEGQEWVNGYLMNRP